jgi:hypothetical protein
LLSFFLALIGAVLTTIAGREAERVARLSAAFGGSSALLVAGWSGCAMASLIAARLGAALAGGLAPVAGTLVVGLALLVAAVALLVLRPGRSPAEPTRSIGAVLLVLGTGLLTGAPGLLIFAVAAHEGAPWLAAAGGALGSGAALTAAWSMGVAWQERMPFGLLRSSVAALLLAAALAIGLSARGLL